MGKSNDVQQEQNQFSTESTESQNNVIREFVEDKTGNPGLKGQVDESTSRISDNQNRLITKHNLRK